MSQSDDWEMTEEEKAAWLRILDEPDPKKLSLEEINISIAKRVGRAL